MIQNLSLDKVYLIAIKVNQYFHSFSIRLISCLIIFQMTLTAGNVHGVSSFCLSYHYLFFLLWSCYSFDLDWGKSHRDISILEDKQMVSGVFVEGMYFHFSFFCRSIFPFHLWISTHSVSVDFILICFTCGKETIWMSLHSYDLIFLSLSSFCFFHHEFVWISLWDNQ